jgi:hypothetical protein
LLPLISDLTLGFTTINHHHPLTSIVLPTMPSSTSNLSVNDQHVVVAAKRKEDDVTAAAQAAVATVHWEQEALIAAVGAARKTLDEAQAQAHQCTAVLTWEKEKTITHHLEQQLTAAQGIAIP